MLSTAENKTEDRETHKQAATEGGCSNGDVHEVQTSVVDFKY